MNKYKIEDNIRSFFVKIHFELKVSGIKKIHLALSQYSSPIQKKIVSYSHSHSTRKIPLEQVDKLVSQNRVEETQRPLIIISVRNVLSNLRCLAYIRGISDGIMSVSEEKPYLVKARLGDIKNPRSYHVLGERDGKLVVEEWYPTHPPNLEWFISGIPVLWDNESAKSLLPRIIPEAANFSDVWHIPRGNHPEATYSSEIHWDLLQKAFMETLMAPRMEAYKHLQSIAINCNLKRENLKLHNILGLDKDGNLWQLIDVGKLEDIGKRIKNRGVTRALCVDSGGSVSVEFYPKGFSGALGGDSQLLVATPNHRISGTAYLVVELRNFHFSYL